MDPHSFVSEFFKIRLKLYCLMVRIVTIEARSVRDASAKTVDPDLCLPRIARPEPSSGLDCAKTSHECGEIHEIQRKKLCFVFNYLQLPAAIYVLSLGKTVLASHHEDGAPRD